MTRATRFALALLSASALGAVSRSAHAEPPNPKATPVYVLSVWTDDADDQADGLTQALRSRARQAQGWSLAETTQSFETLSIALKCPSKPDPPCLQRIGDQLHADHYLWGTMAKKKGGEVTANLHLWSRGKGDTDASETYSDNLKDASDDTLRAVAARMFGKLTGTGATGTVVVHAGGGAGGSVLVDGVEKGTLDGGVARVDVPGGAHMVSVRVPGFDAAAQSVNVAVGTEQDATFALTPAQPAPESSGGSSFPIRKVLGYSALVAGAGFLVAAGIETANWVSDSNASSNDRNHILAPGQPNGISDVCANQINSYAVDACQKSRDATTVSTLGWIFGGAGVVLAATGVWLIATDHGSTESPPPDASARAATPKPKLDVLPMVGVGGGAVDVRLTF